MIKEIFHLTEALISWKPGKVKWWNMLKTREECDTYLTHVCRHHCSVEDLVKRKGAFSQHCFHQLWKYSTSTADKISVGWKLLLFSPGSLCYYDVYRCESGRCCTLPLFLTFFISWKNANPLFCHLCHYPCSSYSQ